MPHMTATELISNVLIQQGQRIVSQAAPSPQSSPLPSARAWTSLTPTHQLAEQLCPERWVVGDVLIQRGQHTLKRAALALPLSFSLRLSARPFPHCPAPACPSPPPTSLQNSSVQSGG